MKRFFIHIPGWAYAMTCYGATKTEAVMRFKLQHGFARMPPRYDIWES